VGMTDQSPPPPNREQRRGFRRQRKRYRLRFEGTSLDGLVVVMESVQIATMLQIAEMASLADELTPEGLQSLGVMFELLAEALIEWNLEEEDGTPVPATIDGVKSLDLGDAMLLIKEWMGAIGGVDRPLDQGSTGGGPSAVASLPMEPLSASQAS
jgi:hypothetical protein